MLESKVKVKIGLLSLALGLGCLVFKAYNPAFDAQSAIALILSICGSIIGLHWNSDITAMKAGLQDNPLSKMTVEDILENFGYKPDSVETVAKTMQEPDKMVYPKTILDSSENKNK